VVVHTCKPGNWEARVRGSGTQDQPGLHSEIAKQNKTNPQLSLRQPLPVHAQRHCPVFSVSGDRTELLDFSLQSNTQKVSYGHFFSFCSCSAGDEP
jgi:hypothetical protein